MVIISSWKRINPLRWWRRLVEKGNKNDTTSSSNDTFSGVRGTTLQAEGHKGSHGMLDGATTSTETDDDDE